jgi:hypothetical protein
MEKKSLVTECCVLLVAALLCVEAVGCSTFSQEKVKSCSAIMGDTMGIISWETSLSVSDSTIYVDVSPAPSSGTFPQAVESGATSLTLSGLTNGTEYTFTVENYNDSGAVYSSANCTGTPSIDKSQAYTYSSSNPYVKLNGNFITLSNVAGKSILFANVNPSDDTISSSDVSIVSKAISRSASTSATAALAELPYARIAATDTARSAAASFDGAGKIRHFIPPKSFAYSASFTPAARTAARSVSTDTDFTVSNPTVGQYRCVYVDNDYKISTYTSKKVTLRAIGTASDSSASVSQKCLLWVADDCFTTDTSSGKQINTTVAQNLATTFAKHYYHERSVFGNESDEHIAPNSTTEAMSETSNPTSTYVNIVVYDIGNDFSNPTTTQSGIVGYFYAKDYYKAEAANYYNDVRDYSNDGKYFYVDAGFCNLSGTDSNGNYSYNGKTDSSGNQVASDTVISTLVHEFQHMIDFNQKNISNGVTPDTWYNEMLSMMAEDMMQTSLGTSDAEAPRGARLPAFNKYYYYSGITDYLDGNYAVLSYSSAYAFGAWVARTYGGPALISKISKNNSVGLDSVIAAIKEPTGTSVTVDSLMEQYLQACVFRTSFASSYSLPTFCKAPGNSITYNGETSVMTPIDLFSTDYKYTNGSTTYYTGPILASSTQQVDVRPHGFLFHAIGSSTNSTVVLAFTPRKNSSEEIYVYVQDKFDNEVK